MISATAKSPTITGIRILREAAIGVELDALAHGAADQLVDRLSRRLAADIPQRDVDARERRGLDRPAAPERVTVHALPAPFAVARIGADDQLLQVLHRPRQRVGLGRQGAFAQPTRPSSVSTRP